MMRASWQADPFDSLRSGKTFVHAEEEKSSDHVVSRRSVLPHPTAEKTRVKEMAQRLQNVMFRQQFIPVAAIAIGLLVVTGTATGADSLWVSTAPLDANRQLLMVVDQQRQTLAVYHIDTASGAVTLRSTRALAFDLQIEDFNATDPKPAALKKMLQIGGDARPARPSARSSKGPQIIPSTSPGG